MSSHQAINQTLLTMLANQIARTHAAFAGLRDEVLTAEPGADCHSILDIGRHLVQLRRFQMRLLESPRAEQVPDPQSINTTEELVHQLSEATEWLEAAIREHDHADWFHRPQPPREGMWGEDPTLDRFVRPFNDFTNHLGSVRVIRRILDNACEKTQ